MKIVITESQYSVLLRRFSLSQIDDEFWYRLKKEDPCEYESFDDFFNWVSYRMEDTIFYKIKENEKLEFDIEKSNNFKNTIYGFVYDNFIDDGERYYNKYRKRYCPRK